MSENPLTSEGLIAVPDSSKAFEEENMDTPSNFEDDLLRQSEEDEIPPYQEPNDISQQKQNQAACQSKTDSPRTFQPGQPAKH